MAGYSKTPLHKKLGLKPEVKAVCINAPDQYLELLGEGASLAEWSDNVEDIRGANFVHLFTANRRELEIVLKAARHKIQKDGMVWVSWPKKASKIPSEISEDTIREVALPLGLVDIKVCAVDEIWSGLKLVIRKELR